MIKEFIIKETKSLIDKKVQYYSNDGSKLYMVRYMRGFNTRLGFWNLHRGTNYNEENIQIDNKPSLIIYYTTGEIKVLERYYLGQYYIYNDEPSCMRFFKDGSKAVESWWTRTLEHRVDQPQHISYFPNGTIREEIWKYQDNMHRYDGPSYSLYDKDGNLKSIGFHINGEDLTKKAAEILGLLKINIDSRKWSNEERMIFKLMFSEV